MAMAVNADQLILDYIEPDPYRTGADEVRLRGQGVAVWMVINYLQATGASVAAAADDYGVAVAAIEAALAYYERHRAAIDAHIEAYHTPAA